MITTLNTVREIGNLTGCRDSLLSHWVPMAERRVRNALGNAVTDACIAYRAYLDTSPSPILPPAGDAADFTLVEMLEANYILFYALPGVNTVFAQTGGISVSGAIGESAYSYLSPGQMDSRRREIMRIIDGLIRLITDTLPIVGGVIDIARDTSTDMADCDVWLR